MCVRGACYIFQSAQMGMTALFYAARFGRTDCAQLLLDVGADTSVKCHVRGCRSLFFHVDGILVHCSCFGVDADTRIVSN